MDPPMPEKTEQSKRNPSEGSSKLREPKLGGFNEEGSDTAEAEPVKKPESRFFGVKSYLHHFYESVALKAPQQYEEYDEYRYLIARKKRRRSLLI